MEDGAWAVEHVAATEFAGLLEEAVAPLKASAAHKAAPNYQPTHAREVTPCEPLTILILDKFVNRRGIRNK